MLWLRFYEVELSLTSRITDSDINISGTRFHGADGHAVKCRMQLHVRREVGTGETRFGNYTLTLRVAIVIG